MLPVQVVKDGVTFAVRVAPRASAEQLGPVENGALKVRLTAPPVEGAANAALVKLLAKALGLPRRQVAVVAGLKSRNKTVWVGGLSPDELGLRLGL